MTGPSVQDFQLLVFFLVQPHLVRAQQLQPQAVVGPDLLAQHRFALRRRDVVEPLTQFMDLAAQRLEGDVLHHRPEQRAQAFVHELVGHPETDQNHDENANEKFEHRWPSGRAPTVRRGGRARVAVQAG